MADGSLSRLARLACAVVWWTIALEALWQLARVVI
jgi:hypothetical protein